MNWLLQRARARAYRKGRRPAPGTLLYSPSLAVIYAWRDAHPKLIDTWGADVNNPRYPRHH